MFVGLARFHKLTDATTHAPKKRNVTDWTWNAACAACTYKWYISVPYSTKQQHEMIIKLLLGQKKTLHFFVSWADLILAMIIPFQQRKEKIPFSKQWLTRYHVYEARLNPSWNAVAVTVTITLFYLHQQNAVTVIQDLFNDLNKQINPQVVNEKVHYRKMFSFFSILIC